MMTLTKTQFRVVYLWLGLVAVLALFPPFEVSRKLANGTITYEGFTRHEFVLSGGETPVNMPASFGGREEDIGGIPNVVTKEISGHALFCELLFLTALCGGLFVRFRSKE